ncbi:hypothetical protein BC834DRAFT_428753 [Gloeopeniophorella convolvens]|nr:hypothetical protein BC834DRAFT_428753 [Gloeopeniophorella convolvens]
MGLRRWELEINLLSAVRIRGSQPHASPTLSYLRKDVARAGGQTNERPAGSPSARLSPACGFASAQGQHASAIQSSPHTRTRRPAYRGPGTSHASRVPALGTPRELLQRRGVSTPACAAFRPPGRPFGHTMDDWRSGVGVGSGLDGTVWERRATLRQRRRPSPACLVALASSDNGQLFMQRVAQLARCTRRCAC